MIRFRPYHKGRSQRGHIFRITPPRFPEKLHQPGRNLTPHLIRIHSRQTFCSGNNATDVQTGQLLQIGQHEILVALILQRGGSGPRFKPVPVQNHFHKKTLLILQGHLPHLARNLYKFLKRNGSGSNNEQSAARSLAVIKNRFVLGLGHPLQIRLYHIPVGCIHPNHPYAQNPLGFLAVNSGKQRFQITGPIILDRSVLGGQLLQPHAGKAGDIFFPGAPLFMTSEQGRIHLDRIHERQGSNPPCNQQPQQNENNLVPASSTGHQASGKTGKKQGKRLLLGLLQHGKEKGPIHLGRSIVKNPDAAGGNSQRRAKAHQLNQPRFHQGALNGFPPVFGGMDGNGFLRFGKRFLRNQFFPVAKKFMPAFAAIHHRTLRGRRHIDMSFALWTIQIHRAPICTFFILLQYLSSQLSSYHVPRENMQETSIGSYFHHFSFSFRLSDFFLNVKTRSNRSH